MMFARGTARNVQAAVQLRRHSANVLTRNLSVRRTMRDQGVGGEIRVKSRVVDVGRVATVSRKVSELVCLRSRENRSRLVERCFQCVHWLLLVCFCPRVLKVDNFVFKATVEESEVSG